MTNLIVLINQGKRRRKHKQHQLCLDKAYNYKSVKQGISNEDIYHQYIVKEKEGRSRHNHDITHQKQYIAKDALKKRTNSWQN